MDVSVPRGVRKRCPMTQTLLVCTVTQPPRPFVRKKAQCGTRQPTYKPLRGGMYCDGPRTPCRDRGGPCAMGWDFQTFNGQRPINFQAVCRSLSQPARAFVIDDSVTRSVDDPCVRNAKALIAADLYSEWSLSLRQRPRQHTLAGSQAICQVSNTTCTLRQAPMDRSIKYYPTPKAC